MNGLCAYTLAQKARNEAAGESSRLCNAAEDWIQLTRRRSSLEEDLALIALATRAATISSRLHYLEMPRTKAWQACRDVRPSVQDLHQVAEVRRSFGMADDAAR